MTAGVPILLTLTFHEIAQLKILSSQMFLIIEHKITGKFITDGQVAMESHTIIPQKYCNSTEIDCN